MSDPVETAAVITHERPSLAADALRRVVPMLHERGISILVPEGECAKHPQVLTSGPHGGCQEVSLEGVAGADICIVLGGDGTILRTLRRTHIAQIPVVGINLGHVGFFAAVSRDRIEEELVRILSGEYVRYELPGIVAGLEGQELPAVNDIVISRGRDTGVCRLAYDLNGVSMFDLRCDGLVVATPQGSSAYNLATGGPLLGLGVSGFVVSYIAPHTLRYRSVVAAHGDVVRVTNQSTVDDVDVLTDGAGCGSLGPGREVTIQAAGIVATLALLPENSFYDQVRTRFF